MIDIPSIIELLAQVGATTPSIGINYEPEIPISLQSDDE